MNRWLDYNDTILFDEWGHPSDNLAAVLSVAEYVSNLRLSQGKNPLTMKDVLHALIKSYEIQGSFALGNSFNAVGLDHVILVKVASAVMATVLLGGDKEAVMSCLSHAWIDGQALRTYRHYPNTCTRKSWAAGDASSRGVYLAFISMRGEMGLKTPLSVLKWGFYDVLFKGKPFKFERPFEEYIMENILFKVSFPAEFHAQTAVEAAIKLNKSVLPKLENIETIHVDSHIGAIRIIDKQGPLLTEADRDHCIQYMISVALLTGNLNAHDYEDKVALDPRIDWLRSKIIVEEDKMYSLNYTDPDERSIANAIQVEFKDGTKSEKVEIKYPLGHRKRRDESIPFIEEKFINNLKSKFTKKRTELIVQTVLRQGLEAFCLLTVPEFVKLFTI